jgi:hypothetical protein
LVLNRPDHLLALENNPGNRAGKRPDDAEFLDAEENRNQADRHPDIALFDPTPIERKAEPSDADLDRLPIIEAHREPP